MDFLNWKNLAAVLIGGVIAGLLFGGYKLYKEKEREDIASKLYTAERFLNRNKTSEVEKLLKGIPEPSKAYILLELGDYQLSKGQKEAALESFKRAAENLKERDKALYYLAEEKVAYLLYAVGKYRESLRVLARFPEDAPDFCALELLKAENYIGLKEFEKAKGELGRIAETCPDRDLKLTAKYLLYRLNKAEINK